MQAQRSSRFPSELEFYVSQPAKQQDEDRNSQIKNFKQKLKMILLLAPYFSHWMYIFAPYDS